EVRVTVPAELVAVSNGALVDVADASDGRRRTFHFKEGVAHVAYLISIVAGDLQLFRDSFGDTPVEYWVPRGTLPEEVRGTFGKPPDILAFFSEWTGVRFPYEKYAQVAVRDFVFGGMENLSATTLTDDAIHRPEESIDFPSEGLLAHEAAHQWWGD